MEFAEAPATEPAGPIRVIADASGARLYLVALPPEALPAVRKRDVERAWEAAHDAARANQWGTLRGFRFRRRDGAVPDLILADASAACWAASVDRITGPDGGGLSTIYGMSLCLRLLALVDLLARARWLDGLCRMHRGAAHLDVALLRLAAASPLTAQAGFDDALFRAQLFPLAPAFPLALDDKTTQAAQHRAQHPATRRLTGASA